jgi:cation transport protein ChaC
MWIFGYGSLMWDRWEQDYGCFRRARATLHGYRRAFNKLSVRNWGTEKFPCPTLNLIRSDSSSCQGIAFEFPDDRKQQVMTYLEGREGKGFKQHQLPVRLDRGNEVIATVAIYEGKNRIASDEVRHVVEMILHAVGEDGSCFHYLKGINDELHRLGIDDPVVRELWDTVESRRAMKSHGLA